MDLLNVGRMTVLVIGLFSTVATAQVFSPGEMSKAHAKLSSVSDCDWCHSTKNKVDRDKCLSCHGTLWDRIHKKTGFHGQPDVRTKPCEKCHKEHRGKDAPLIPWPDNKKESFDHKQTGWPLGGAHQKLACTKCHDKRLIKDKNVLAYLKENPNATAQEGLSTECTACHFDEHRGETGKKCNRCHNETSFKKPEYFSHYAVWPLEGAHQKVACEKCHKKTTDSNYNPKAFPKPRSDTYLHRKPVAHASCTDCHQDPHRDRFGTDCLSCHNMDSWNLSEPPKDKTFHDKTGFPLKGRHRFVPCARCHPKGKDGKTRLKPVAHDRCYNCHPNAHPDIPDEEMKKKDCTSCHDDDGFKPSKFSIERHQQTKFPLKDAHTAAACTACHLHKLGEPNPTFIAAHNKKFLSSLVVSPWRLRSDIAPNDCAKCHVSPHRDQFKATPCTDCHNGKTWTGVKEKFDHDRKTQFKLKGKHKKLACSACHPEEKDSLGTFVRYRPLPFGDCSACHKDVHYGQFDLGSKKKACHDCHSEEGFTPPKFNHNDKKQCDFALRGKHAKLPCIRCHPKVQLKDNIKIPRYRPTVTECGGCHEDLHHGAYKDAARLLHRQSLLSSLPAPKEASSVATAAGIPPASWFGLQKSERTDCTTCHVETGWSKVSFDHSATKFPLVGMHKKVPCDKCHQEERDLGTRMQRGCEGCHQDPHRGRLGTDCEECHSESGFDNTDKMRARHNRTSFPLTGRHAALPCTECHQDVRDLGFNRTPTDCVACHEDDIPGPGESQMDHSTLTQDCASCHTTVGFEKASYKGHDSCFPIGAFTRHGSVSCEKCHQGALPSPGGGCEGDGFSCTQCHTCLTDKHRGVNGYSCEERRCYECHRNP
jgi:hypothetical protein